MYIIGLNGYLMVTGAQINLGEILCAGKTIEQVINSRQGVAVPHRSLIQKPKIDAHPQSAILFSRKQYWGAPTRPRGAHPRLFQILLELGFDFIQLLLRHAILTRTRRRQRLILQHYGMLDAVRGWGPLILSKDIRKIVTHCLPPGCLSLWRGVPLLRL